MRTNNQLVGIIAAAILLTFSACKKDDNFSNPGASASSTGNEMIAEGGANPDEAVFTEDANARQGQRSGYVYTESNEVAQNTILVFAQNADGTLTAEGTTTSGGTGTGAGLGSQGAVVLDEHHHWLFAVNAGSNSVSSFEVHNDGSLTLAHTVSSGGTLPISITTSHNLLYVVNSGSDNIAGFTLGTGGDLTPISGSVHSLSATGAGPAQIYFSPNGNYLYVSEKATNTITTFHVNGSGVASAGTSIPSTGQTPFGFEFARNNYMIVSNAAGGAAGLGSATSYSGINTGNISSVNGAVANNQAAPCWVAITQFGRYAFTTNTASDNISTYYVTPTGSLHLIHAAIPSGDAPSDMAIIGNYYVYARCGNDHTIQIYNRTALGGLTPIGSSTIPDHAVGLAAF